jgi:addiction module HigA family antidote
MTGIGFVLTGEKMAGMKSKSWIITSGVEMSKRKKFAPVHPGEILKDELQELRMSGNALALALRIPANRVTEIIKGKRAVSADTALRLARYFCTSAQMWMNLQSRFDLETAEESIAARVEAEVQPLRHAS